MNRRLPAVPLTQAACFRLILIFLLNEGNDYIFQGMLVSPAFIRKGEWRRASSPGSIGIGGLFLISPARPPWIERILARMAVMPDEPSKLEA